MSYEKLTILVNSCDAYEDLWYPFFTLLKKYGHLDKTPIILNTESKSFAMDGLEITCVHSPKNAQYGKRMRNALDCVETEYVLMLLDDFFLRNPLDQNKIHEMIFWMDADRDIACFNCEKMDCYVAWEKEKYPGFARIPPGNAYACNMQAAIWRTGKLKKYWRANISPWEWEEYCSLLTGRFPKDKLYCRTETGSLWIDYGHYQVGDLWAVVRGKWIIEDVKPLFDKEKIEVDFFQRGIYHPQENRISDHARRGQHFALIARCLGAYGVSAYLAYRIKRLFQTGSLPEDADFFSYLKQRIQEDFLSQIGDT